jgi:hypothetical protein
MDTCVHLPSRRSFMRRFCIGSALMLVAVGAVFGQATGDHEKSMTAFRQIAQVMRSRASWIERCCYGSTGRNCLV